MNALATALLALYPFALYLYGALYSDSLFLLLVLAAFIALEEGKILLLVDGQEFNETLYASLALTGRGHATDRAVILGLAGFEPKSLDPDLADTVIGLTDIANDNAVTGVVFDI